MICRALLLGLFLALPATAQGGGAEIIDEAAMEAELRDFQTRIEQVRKNALPLDGLVQHYREGAQAKGTPRQRAVAAFLNGFVLKNVVPNKDHKEAKREFLRALELAPGLLPAYAELAAIADQAGDRVEAERLLRRALELKRDYVRAYIDLAQMTQRAGDLKRAKELYQQSLEYVPHVMAFAGLIFVNTRLFVASYDEREREKLAKEALLAADAIVTLEPDAPQVRLIRARVLLDLGRIKEAIDYLEGLHAEGQKKPQVEMEILLMLRGVYQLQGSVEGVKSAIDRLLKCEAVKPEDRARISERAKDLDKMGRNAFLKWQIEDAIQDLHNPGLSVEQRLAVLRGLQEFVAKAIGIEELHGLAVHAHRECFRVLVDGTPELVVSQLRSLRAGGPPPRLMAVLVHFVYPTGKTEEVREEGIRAVAACGGAAAIPALYYSLQDASGRVVREIDSQLSLLCERRSPFGGTIEPLTPEQRTQALRAWTAYFHSPEGAARLAKAFEQLSGCVLRVEPDRTSAPMIDHAGHVILDGDMPWEAWVAAYDFMVKYWGKDFRPVDRRGKPVEPHERGPIVSAFEEEFSPKEPPPPPPAPRQPSAKAGQRNKGN